MIYLLLINVWLLFITICHAQPEKPAITSVTQLNENSVNIKWNVRSKNLFKLQLTRFRIQLSEDDFKFDIREWPAQFHEFVSDTNGQILNVTTVKSNYECYNLCIRNPICATATMLSRKGFNCFLKSKYDSYRNPPIDSEIIRISEYKNEVRLNFLPYNQVYKFRVAVYDQISNQWSEFSDPSTELLTKIDIKLYVKRVNYNTLRLNWKKVGNYTNYIISRYNIQVSLNEEPYKDNYDTNHLNTTLMEPKYFESSPPLLSNNGLVNTEAECYYKCLEFFHCVQYVYYKLNGSCYFTSGFEPLNGIRDDNAVANFIQSNSNEYYLKNLELFSNYKIRLQFKTPYGSLGTSNLVTYVLTSLKPKLRIDLSEDNDFGISLNWTIPESLKTRGYAVFYSVNDSATLNQYLTPNEFDYEDTNALTFKSNLTECYTRCLDNTICKAVSWNITEGRCFLKSKKGAKKQCNNDSVCISLPDTINNVKIKNHFVNTKYCYNVMIWTSYGFSGEKSNQICFIWNATVTNKVDSSEFIEKESTSFKCEFNGIEKDQISSIKWYRDGEELNSTHNLFFDDKEFRLEIMDLSHFNDNGKYECSLELTNSQVIFSNKVELRAKYGPFIKLTSEQDSLNVDEYKSISFGCIGEGYPLPNIKWKFNGEEISDYHYNQTRYIKQIWIDIKNATKDNNGTYACYLNDKLHHSVNLFVNYGPIFLTESNYLSANENQSLNFNCTVEQYPAPIVTWINLKTNETLSSEKVNEINKQTAILKFDRITRKDFATYGCYANDNQANMITFELFVNFPTYLQEKRDYVEVFGKELDNCEMKCTSIGFPVSFIDWHSSKNNESLIPEFVTNSTYVLTSHLVLKNLTKQHTGNYTCQVSGNPAEKQVFSLIVQSKPSRPIITEVEVMSNQKTRILLFLDDNGESEMQQAFIQWSHNPHFNESVMIKNLTIDSEKSIKQKGNYVELIVNYSIPEDTFLRIWLRNSIDKSELSKPIKINKSEGFIRLPLNIILLVFMSVTVPIAIILISFIIFKKLKQSFKRKAEAKKNASLKKNESLKSFKSISINFNDFTNVFSTKKLKETNDKIESEFKTLKNNPSASKIDLIEPSSPSNSCYNNLIEMKNRKSSKINRASSSKKSFEREKTLKTGGDAEDKSISSYNAEKNWYTKDALVKRMIDNFETLDKDMHFEFCEIRNPNNKTFEDSLKLGNERKSRYKHVYPYDDNRVKLSLIAGRPDSDFINASYIEGYNKQKKFIAAQGPTKETASDFLRMLSEKEIKVVVMLTQIYEGDPPLLKCWPYWNDNNIIRFGLVSVQVKFIERNSFYEYRKMEIKLNDKSTTIDHYLYKEWPDKSCPNESQSIIELIAKINNDYGASEFPILVHCSAGIGRTGSFIAIYTLIDMMKDTNSINAKKIVTEMRKQRAFLVQNWEQYKYIHKSLLEYSLFNNCTVNINNRDLCKSLISDLNKMEAEYNDINKIREISRLRTFTFETLLKKELQLDDKSEESVDSVSINNKSNAPDFFLIKNPHLKLDFFLTSEPKLENLNNYLLSILKIRPVAIISTSSEESTYLSELNETCLNKTLTDGIFVLCKQLFFNSDKSLVKVYELELIDIKNKENSFKTFYYTLASFWPEDQEGQFPKCELNQVAYFLDSFLKFVKSKSIISQFTKQELTQNIILQSKDSNTFERCELMLAMLNCYSSLSQYRHFNLVQTLRVLRKNYPHFINKFEQYKYLYETCCSNEIFNNLNDKDANLNM